MFILKSNVQETSDSDGVGAFILRGRAVYSSLTFSDTYQDNDTFYYRIENTVVKDEWEEGVGTYVASTNSITRTEVYGNSESSNQALNFSQGTKIVFVNPYAEAMVVFDPDGNLIRNGSGSLYEQGYGIDLSDDTIAKKTPKVLLQEATDLDPINFTNYADLSGNKFFTSDSDDNIIIAGIYLGSEGRIFQTLHSDTDLAKICLWRTDSSVAYDATILVPTTSTDDIPVDNTTDKYTSAGTAPSGDILGFADCKLLGVKVFTYSVGGNLITINA